MSQEKNKVRQRELSMDEMTVDDIEGMYIWSSRKLPTKHVESSRKRKHEESVNTRKNDEVAYQCLLALFDSCCSDFFHDMEHTPEENRYYYLPLSRKPHKHKNKGKNVEHYKFTYRDKKYVATRSDLDRAVEIVKEILNDQYVSCEISDSKKNDRAIYFYYWAKESGKLLKAKSVVEKRFGKQKRYTESHDTTLRNEATLNDAVMSDTNKSDENPNDASTYFSKTPNRNNFFTQLNETLKLLTSQMEQASAQHTQEKSVHEAQIRVLNEQLMTEKNNAATQVKELKLQLQQLQQKNDALGNQMKKLEKQASSLKRTNTRRGNLIQKLKKELKENKNKQVSTIIVDAQNVNGRKDVTSTPSPQTTILPSISSQVGFFSKNPDDSSQSGTAYLYPPTSTPGTLPVCFDRSTFPPLYRNSTLYFQP